MVACVCVRGYVFGLGVCVCVRVLGFMTIVYVYVHVCLGFCLRAYVCASAAYFFLVFPVDVRPFLNMFAHSGHIAVPCRFEQLREGVGVVDVHVGAVTSRLAQNSIGAAHLLFGRIEPDMD